MTFYEWLNEVSEGDNCSVYDHLIVGDYVKLRDILSLIEEAFYAGRNSNNKRDSHDKPNQD